MMNIHRITVKIKTLKKSSIVIIYQLTDSTMEQGDCFFCMIKRQVFLTVIGSKEFNDSMCINDYAIRDCLNESCDQLL